jgi:hypothetical protein
MFFSFTSTQYVPTHKYKIYQLTLQRLKFINNMEFQSLLHVFFAQKKQLMTFSKFIFVYTVNHTKHMNI